MRIASVIVMLIAIIGLSIYIGMKEPEVKIVYQDRITRDTITHWIEQPNDTIVIRAKSHTIYLTDTIIETRPFIAQLDTIIERDTVFVSYQYPAELFRLQIKRAADSIPIRYITIETLMEVNSELWWEKPLYAAGGLVIGYGFGRLSQ